MAFNNLVINHYISIAIPFNTTIGLDPWIAPRTRRPASSDTPPPCATPLHCRSSEAVCGAGRAPNLVLASCGEGNDGYCWVMVIWLNISIIWLCMVKYGNCIMVYGYIIWFMDVYGFILGDYNGKS